MSGAWHRFGVRDLAFPGVEPVRPTRRVPLGTLRCQAPDRSGMDLEPDGVLRRTSGDPRPERSRTHAHAGTHRPGDRRRAFRSPDKPSTLTIISNLIPGVDPTAGPIYCTFSPRARPGGLPPDLAQRRLVPPGGLTQSELAAQLDQPLGTIKSRMFTGLQRFRMLLVEAGYE